MSCLHIARHQNKHLIFLRFSDTEAVSNCTCFHDQSRNQKTVPAGRQRGGRYRPFVYCSEVSRSRRRSECWAANFQNFLKLCQIVSIFFWQHLPFHYFTFLSAAQAVVVTSLDRAISTSKNNSGARRIFPHFGTSGPWSPRSRRNWRFCNIGLKGTFVGVPRAPVALFEIRYKTLWCRNSQISVRIYYEIDSPDFFRNIKS